MKELTRTKARYWKVVTLPYLIDDNKCKVYNLFRRGVAQVRDSQRRVCGFLRVNIE